MKGRADRRYPAVPWLEPSDLAPMGEPETSVELPGDVTLGLCIAHPFGPATDAVLAIRAIQNGTAGGVITVAINRVITRAPAAPEGWCRVPAQSNPRRVADDGDAA